MENIIEKIVSLIQENWEVDAVYLYGSRADGRARPESDWDIAVLFQEFIKDSLESALRPQEVEALLERELQFYERISVVDLERVPVALQHNIIMGQRVFDRKTLHVQKVEHGIISKIEKDYEFFEKPPLRK